MDDGADRHHAKAWLILIVFVVEARQRLGAGLAGRIVEPISGRGTRPAARARGGGEAEEGDCCKATAECDRGPGRRRQEAVRARQNRVADHPAETRGQRPASGRWKQRSQPRRGDHSDQVEADLQARPLKPSLGDEAPTPERGRGEQGRRGKADKLHHQVGGDRAWSAEKIVDARVGRVVEAGIADRPGQQRKGQAGHAGERDEASDFGRPPLRELAHRSGHLVDK